MVPPGLVNVSQSRQQASIWSEDWLDTGCTALLAPTRCCRRPAPIILRPFPQHIDVSLLNGLVPCHSAGDHMYHLACLGLGLLVLFPYPCHIVMNISRFGTSQ